LFENETEKYYIGFSQKTSYFIKKIRIVQTEDYINKSFIKEK